MSRVLLIAAGLALLAGCTAGAEGNPWYSEGDATYDSIKSASDACTTKGGKFQLKSGGESTHLGDYECVMPKGKS